MALQPALPLEPDSEAPSRRERESSRDASLVMTVAETATALRVSDDTVYELVQRGDLPCLQLGRRKVIPRRAVELIVEQALDGFDPRNVASRLSPPGR